LTNKGSYVITIYRARKIYSMNRSQPEATHIAIRDGKILGIGSYDELKGWGQHQLDETFADQFFMPGFIEGHCHAVEGTFWRHRYCGYFDRRDPDGTVWAGLKSKRDVIARLAEMRQSLGESEKTTITGWGFDPIYFEDAQFSRRDLDLVSETSVVALLHASSHILNVNSKVLALANLLRPNISHPGVILGADGLPTGELRGPEAIGLVIGLCGFGDDLLACDEAGLVAFGKLCVRAGVTTATDLANPLTDASVDMMLDVTARNDYPARIVPFLRMRTGYGEPMVQRAVDLKARTTPRLDLGRIKLVADGSIQGFSARLNWPGYFNGAPNGLWYCSLQEVLSTFVAALKSDIQIHVHTNGDQATDMVLDAMEQALKLQSSREHRFTIQHGQMATAAMLRKMSAFGMCVNFFANHLYFWGDQHVEITLGPERARRMNPCGSALALGIPVAVHSDAPITPLNPLFTAWCAVNRKTVSGRVLGEQERLSVGDALEAITLGAARTLKLDHQIGSLQTGKWADITILNEDPYACAPGDLKNLNVTGTLQSGRLFLVSSC
jgi:predicted amidohydrolase YtcJ